MEQVINEAEELEKKAEETKDAEAIEKKADSESWRRVMAM